MVTKLSLVLRAFGSPKTAAITSSILVLPLLMLEWAKRGSFNEGFPLALFGFLWLLPFALILLLGIVASPRPQGTAAHLLRLLAAVFVFVTAYVWIAIVVDQMPCFLGVPNCD